MKIALNKMRFGFFSLSWQAIEKYCLAKNITTYKYGEPDGVCGVCFFLEPYEISEIHPLDQGLKEFYGSSIERNDPVLIQIIEEMGESANDYSSELKIIEIPDDVEWEIDSYEDGVEFVREKHRVWGK